MTLSRDVSYSPQNERSLNPLKNINGWKMKFPFKLVPFLERCFFFLFFWGGVPCSAWCLVGR